MKEEKNRSARSVLYRIEIQGRLDIQWSDWFMNMSVGHRGSNTILEGWLPDTCALHGLLNRIRDLNLVLISVNRLESGHAGESEEGEI